MSNIKYRISKNCQRGARRRFKISDIPYFGFCERHSILIHVYQKSPQSLRRFFGPTEGAATGHHVVGGVSIDGRRESPNVRWDGPSNKIPETYVLPQPSWHDRLSEVSDVHQGAWTVPYETL